MIGVGITTRNRLDVLDYTLSQFVKHHDKNQDIVVIDDCSDDLEAVQALDDKYGMWVDFIYNEERLGIAKSKNELIKEFAEHDGMVLFDDDCFPTKECWYTHFLKAWRDHKQHHMIYAREPQIVLDWQARSADVWKGCLGVAIWLSKYAVQRVGGWDPRFKIYGVEHHELTGRCHKAKLSPLGMYVSPRNISDYIWCFDTDGDHGGFKWMHKSCMDEKEKGEAIAENNAVVRGIIKENNKSVYREIY